MRRALLAVLVLAVPARAAGSKETGGADLLATALAIPYAWSLDLPEEGYARWPYEAGTSGDFGDRPLALRFGSYFTRVGDGARGAGGFWRMDTERHVGLEVFWTHYHEKGEEDLNHLAFSTHGDLWRDERVHTDYQLGLAALSGRLTRLGPRLSLEAESYPLKPFSLDASVAASFIDGGPMGDFRVGTGVSWERWSVRLGYRALLGPFHALEGPEAGASVRF